MSKTGSSSSFPTRDDDSIMAIQRTSTSRSGSSSVSSKSKTTTTAKPSKARGGGGKPSGKFLGGIFRKVADWASTSEPSMQALSQYKQEAFQRAGVSPNDSEAHTKLHAPMGKIPEDAIRPTTGPTPEEVLMRKKTERKKRQIEEELRRGSIGSSGRGGSSPVRLGSVSSSTMSGGRGFGTGTGTASSTVGSGSSRKGSVLGGSSAVPWDASGW
ncbi:hypothetical protein NEUTE1DRAFT_150391 [Neurospora tetrasperma FGSC 2508]|uniref:Uncharacterized protein n=1 Tax=Neurospora tetrasperma (strain FGSC 2508 / ATCC MYA-4615 / P0657) TaxID=510951 RepID=F8N0D9_NEUT8|nr:uncharacterized protein NEUTE1DRAFT_150391 [Neurospora tetrasperma FGSC 2508]EGO52967.1 hypothetical protein NEUTE1DRAFT_150391 [Neurospora tetrasperma FGSC 2508]